MNLFGSHDLPEPELSNQKIAAVLVEIKRNARNRRLALFAPVALAAAVTGAIVAAPHRYGGLDLVPEAGASIRQLPRVFGSNGVWRLAEPIVDDPAVSTGPASVIEAPVEPAAPTYVLVAPDRQDAESLPVSASTPPTPTPGQSLVVAAEDSEVPAGEDALSGDPIAEEPEVAGVDEIDWSRFRPIIVVDAAAPAQSTSSTPEDSTTVEQTTTPQISSPDEDVSVVETQPTEPTGEAAELQASDTGDLSEANPSTPPEDPAEEETQPESGYATITPRSVLVHSAHVSVTVQVVDDDSSVIDWCNTRVDWGDGSVTGLTDVDGVASCTAPCEYAASPSAIGIDTEVVFTHDYQSIIDAAPRIYVATGDGCSYTLAEFQLNPFAVVPY